MKGRSSKGSEREIGFEPQNPPKPLQTRINVPGQCGTPGHPTSFRNSPLPLLSGDFVSQKTPFVRLRGKGRASSARRPLGRALPTHRSGEFVISFCLTVFRFSQQQAGSMRWRMRYFCRCKISYLRCSSIAAPTLWPRHWYWRRSLSFRGNSPRNVSFASAWGSRFAKNAFSSPLVENGGARILCLFLHRTPSLRTDGQDLAPGELGLSRRASPCRAGCSRQ